MITKEIMIDDRKITYCLTRKKVKNINFRIKEDQIVHISAQPSIKISVIEKILRDKKQWLFKHLDRFKAYEAEMLEYVTGDQLYYLGKQLTLIVKAGQQKKVWIENDQLYLQCKERQKKADRVKRLERWYRQQAKREFSRLTAKVFQDLHFKGELPKVRVIKMKKRYGTCYYHRNQINLNLKLIKADPEVIEFVIAHELTHLKHHNHSKKFYAALTKAMPDWQQREQGLKDLKIMNYYNL